MGFLDKIKNIVGIEDDEYYDDEYEEEYDADESAKVTSTAPKKEEPAAETHAYTEASKSGRRTTSSSSVLGLAAASSSGRVRISIQEPLSYDDGPKILDDVMNAKTVVLNLEMLEVDKKRQIFDFVSGGVYSLGGDIQKVTKDIFVIAPKGVEIDGKLKEQVGSSLYQA